MATKKTETARKTKPLVRLSEEMATTMLAESDFSLKGGIQAVLERYSISHKTYNNWRNRLKTRPDLARSYELKRKRLATEFDDKAVQFLRSGIAKLDSLCAEAKVDQIREVAGAIHIVGNLFVASRALNGQPVSPDPPGSEPEEAPALASDSGAAESVH